MGDRCKHGELVAHPGAHHQTEKDVRACIASDTKHTPTPYRVEMRNGVPWILNAHGACVAEIVDTTKPRDQADALVEAVNNHARLTRENEAMRGALERIAAAFRDDGATIVLETVRAAVPFVQAALSGTALKPSAKDTPDYENGDAYEPPPLAWTVLSHCAGLLEEAGVNENHPIFADIRAALKGVGE